LQFSIKVSFSLKKQANLPNSKQLIEDCSKEFQNIKRISREYENITRPLERHLPALPLDQMRNKEDEDMRQIYAWKRYILWEKQNPLKLENHQEVMRRVIFAYEQSFLCLAYNFEIWFEAACYLTNQKEILKEKLTMATDEASTQLIEDLTHNAASLLYERAINSFMKNNSLIHLAFADFEEV
jgi:cleavage stimulation factor subunit 3